MPFEQLLHFVVALVQEPVVVPVPVVDKQVAVPVVVHIEQVVPLELQPFLQQEPEQLSCNQH